MPWLDVAADVQAIRNGEARRVGNTFTVNGRTYVLEPSRRLFPTVGAGFHQLNRGAFRALALYNDEELSVDPDWMLDLESVDEEDRETARRILREIKAWGREP